MQHNLLIRTLKELPRKKVTRFSEFARSPYFNKHRDTQRLITYLVNIYPNYTAKKCHRETIFQLIFPALPHDQKKLAVIFTYAMRLLEQFFRVEESIKNGSLEDQVLMASQLRSMDLEFLLKNKWKEIIKGVNNSFSRKSTCERLNKIVAYEELDKIVLGLRLHSSDFLSARQPQLDRFYMMEKLKDGCELLQRSKLMRQPFLPSELFLHHINWLEKNRVEAKHIQPAIYLFLDIYKMIKENEEELYFRLKKDIPCAEPYINIDELKMIYNNLQNFCIQKINAGKKEFLNELFEIYNSQLEKELLLIKNQLSEWHYKNIVTTALRLEKYDWVKTFIYEKKDLLRPEVKQNAFTFNIANYYYHIGEFHEVLKLLLQVEYTDLRYNLDAKALLLRTYYDTNEEVSLISLTDSFRQYLKRNKEMTEFQKKGYYNLLKFARTAFKLKINKGFITHSRWTAALEKLMKGASETKTIFNKIWLQEKIRELKAME